MNPDIAMETLGFLRFLIRNVLNVLKTRVFMHIANVVIYVYVKIVIKIKVMWIYQNVLYVEHKNKPAKSLRNILRNANNLLLNRF